MCDAHRLCHPMGGLGGFSPDGTCDPGCSVTCRLLASICDAAASSQNAAHAPDGDIHLRWGLTRSPPGFSATQEVSLHFCLTNLPGLTTSLNFAFTRLLYVV